MSAYCFGRATALDANTAIERVTAALAQEGFGILTRIDVADTLKKKIGREMPPYVILGACNPQFAAQAIAVEPQIGALLPCNVVVRVDEQGRTHIEIMDPASILALVGRPEVGVLAAEVRTRFERVLAAVG